MFDVWAADKVKTITAYEVLPRNFEIAKKNLEDNNIKNVMFINTGVSARGETIDLYYEEWIEWCNSIRKKWPDAKHIEAGTSSIREIFLREPEYTKIKCDIEWMEYEIFTDDFVIPSSVSQIIMELHQPTLSREAQAIFDSMEKQGFNKKIYENVERACEKAFTCLFYR